MTDAFHAYPEPGPVDAGIGPRFEWFPFQDRQRIPEVYVPFGDARDHISDESGDVVLECVPIKVDDQIGLTEREWRLLEIPRL
jgi:hypothetical protein